jgi:hypothetical protein
MIVSLQEASAFYGGAYLSQAKYRRWHKDVAPSSPSDVPICQETKSWPLALKMAGLPYGPKFSRTDMVRALRAAHRFYKGAYLSADKYGAWRTKASPNSPSFTPIYRQFSNWPTVLRAIGLEGQEQPVSLRSASVRNS